MFSITPNPTFEAEITLPTLNGEAKFKLVYKHKGRKALKAFTDSLSTPDGEERDMTEALLEVVEGWSGITEKFSKETFALMVDNYPQAGPAMLETYYKSLYAGQVKN
jgi:hypothetical protein